jgi:hypothetical protein
VILRKTAEMVRREWLTERPQVLNPADQKTDQPRGRAAGGPGRG